MMSRCVVRRISHSLYPMTVNIKDRLIRYWERCIRFALLREYDFHIKNRHTTSTADGPIVFPHTTSNLLQPCTLEIGSLHPDKSTRIGALLFGFRSAAHISAIAKVICSALRPFVPVAIGACPVIHRDSLQTNVASSEEQAGLRLAMPF